MFVKLPSVVDIIAIVYDGAITNASILTGNKQY